MNTQATISDSMHSVEAEQQLLGAVLCNNDCFDSVSDIIKHEHFFDPVHADIWRNLTARISKGHHASATTLQQDLSAHTGLKELGGSTYLVKLASASISAFAVRDYAQMIVELHIRRSLVDAFSRFSADLQNNRDAGEVVSEAEILLTDCVENSPEPKTMSFLKAQTNSIQNMIEVFNGNQVAVPSGLRGLDDMISFAPKRYTLLGGSTSMGKTALALHIAFSAARQGFGVGFVTLEMPEEDLANRINSIESGLAYNTYDRPMSEHSFRQVADAAQRLESLPIEIFSERVRDVPAILSEGKKIARKMQPNGKFKGFKLLVIDYIQLVRGRGSNSFESLSQVANDLKQVAKQLDVHVLALAQVDRQLGKLDKWDQWPQARPSLAHLRGSGDLENAPDNVMFVFRPQYFLTPPRCTPPSDPSDRADWESEYEQWKGKAEIIIGKARMGEIGSVTVGCDLSVNRFWDLDDGQERIAF